MNLKRERIRAIDEVFERRLEMTLILEEIPLEDIARVRDVSRDIQIAKTLNRAVLGSINDLIYQYMGFIESYAEGRISPPEVVRQMNRLYLSYIDGMAIEKFKEHFGIDPRQKSHH